MLNAKLASLPTYTKHNVINKDIAIVYDVILDTTHHYLKDVVLPSSYIGGVLFRRYVNIGSTENELEFAYPLDMSIKNLPTKNEPVNIFHSGGSVFYSRFVHAPSPNINVEQSTITTKLKPEPNTSQTTDDYSTRRHTKIPKREQSVKTEDNIYGKYFTADTRIHSLKLNEGDLAIESRFGQSIRMSGYNNDERKLSPTIIIRNRESDITKGNTNLAIVDEDILRDGSVIVMGSNRYLLPFTPGTVDDRGSSDFQTKPKSFTNYPSELYGDQLLLNSGRIILSSKHGELIFYSKKNYGFISDGTLSIDNKGGIVANVGGDVVITTNNRDIKLKTGNGNIELGDGDGLEPLVLGDTLRSLLAELIDILSNQIFLTPSGPTSTGPTNRPQLLAVKTKLQNILSVKNKTI
jgi:hypothetical protein